MATPLDLAAFVTPQIFNEHMVVAKAGQVINRVIYEYKTRRKSLLTEFEKVYKKTGETKLIAWAVELASGSFRAATEAEIKNGTAIQAPVVRVTTRGYFRKGSTTWRILGRFPRNLSTPRNCAKVGFKSF